MTWDSIDILDWSKTYRPQPWVLSVTTTGCGCCADGKIVYSTAEAVAIVKEYIEERKDEIAHWENWLQRMGTSRDIQPTLT